MAQPVVSPCLSMEELTKTDATSEFPTILQFGSEICAHCPAATISISKLTSCFKFKWIYSDANSDLAEEFTVSKLPAIVIWRGQGGYSLYQGLRGDDAEKVIKMHCSPHLSLDADF